MGQWDLYFNPKPVLYAISTYWLTWQVRVGFRLKAAGPYFDNYFAMTGPLEIRTMDILVGK